jgi:hypothetical protein
MQEEGWTSNVYNYIAWDSFATAFNKLSSSLHVIVTKTIFSFWCTDDRHQRDRGQIKDCCFCGAPDEYWRHVMTCNGTGALIFRTGAWAELRKDLIKWPIHQDIWCAIEHRLLHFTKHPGKNVSTRPRPPFGSSLRANHVLLNNAAASQTSIGWHNLMKGGISKEWSTLWSKAMGAHLASTCERAMIRALWNHSYCLWIFRNNEDNKNDNRAIAEYKQRELDDNIAQLNTLFATSSLPINPLQASHFDIQQEQLLLLSYDIRRAWLRYVDSYISRATARGNLTRGTHAQFILQHTSGRPTDPSTRQQ